MPMMDEKNVRDSDTFLFSDCDVRRVSTGHWRTFSVQISPITKSKSIAHAKC